MLWALTALSLLGVVLNIKKKRSCFVLWIITNGLWAAVDFYSGLQAQAILDNIDKLKEWVKKQEVSRKYTGGE